MSPSDDQESSLKQIIYGVRMQFAVLSTSPQEHCIENIDENQSKVQSTTQLLNSGISLLFTPIYLFIQDRRST